MAAPAVPWVATVFYGAVLLAGLTALDGPRWTLAGFIGGLVLLMALDLGERLRYPGRTPVRVAAALLATRLVLTATVILLDASHVSRVLIVLIPFQAYFAFGRHVSLALAGTFQVAAPVVLAVADPGWFRNPEKVGDLVMLSLGILMAVAMAAVAVEAETGRVRLQEAQGELAELSAAAERARLARDLHDSVGHHLTAIAVQLEKSASFRDLDRAAADQALSDARQSARLALSDVRTAVRTLRETSGPVSLAALLAELAARLSGPNLRVSSEVTGSPHGYDHATLDALYRVAQEGLTNAVKHASAGHAVVRVDLGADIAVLEVTDDGCGLPQPGPSAETAEPAAATDAPAALERPVAAMAGPADAVIRAAAAVVRPDHDAGHDLDPGPIRNAPRRAGRAAAGYGLIGIQERVQTLGGRLLVRSAPEAGTTLTITVPRRAGAA